MWKLAFVLLVLACSGYADEEDNQGSGGLPGFFNFGNKFPNLFNFPSFKMPIIPVPDPNKIKDMTCTGENSKCEGSYKSESSSMKMINGVLVEDKKKSDAVQNVNGTVTEQHSEKN